MAEKLAAYISPEGSREKMRSEAGRRHQQLAGERIEAIRRRHAPWEPDPLVEITRKLEINRIVRLKLAGIYKNPRDQE